MSNMLFFLLFISVQGADPKAKLPTCDEKYFDIQSSFCQELAKPNPIYLQNPDGSHLTNFNYYENNYVGQKLSQIPETATEVGASQKKRVMDIFGVIKNKFVEKIKAYRTSLNQSPNSQDQFLIDRINKMQLLFANLGEGCKKGVADAGQSLIANAVTLCPDIGIISAEALVPIVAHEIAHAVDFCFMNVYKFKRPLMDALKAKNSKILSVCYPNQKERDIKFKMLRKQFALGVDSILVLNPEEETLVETLERCKVLEVSPMARLDDIDKAPFQNIHQGVQAVIPSSELMELEEDQRKFEEAFGQTRFLSGHPKCHPKVSETFADRLGGEVTADLVREKPRLFRSGYEEQLLYFYTSLHCASKDQESSMYPRSSQRLALMLQFPEIQSMMKCSGLSVRPIYGIEEQQKQNKSTNHYFDTPEGRD